MNGQFANFSSAQAESESGRRSGTSKESSREHRLFLVGQQDSVTAGETTERTGRSPENGVLVLAPAGVDNLLIGRALDAAAIPVELCSNVDRLCDSLSEIVGTIV